MKRVSKNFDRNLLLSNESDLVVIEADEYDRSFFTLTPYMAVVTAVDADHLDVYGTEKEYRAGFEEFVSLIRPDGVLLMKENLPISPRLQKGVKIYTYSIEKGDFHAENIRIGGGEIIFDFVGPDVRIADVQLGVPVYVNLENGIAAMAMAWMNGVSEKELKEAMATFASDENIFFLRGGNLVFFVFHLFELNFLLNFGNNFRRHTRIDVIACQNEL